MIYVDKLRNWPNKKAKWCHLLSDEGEEELHTFAKRIGLRRKWYQGQRDLPHYDLSPGFREKAVEAGAIELDYWSDLLQIIRKVRKWNKK